MQTLTKSQNPRRQQTPTRLSREGGLSIMPAPPGGGISEERKAVMHGSRIQGNVSQIVSGGGVNSNIALN